jgi:uncharacterized membrane protein
MMLDQEVDAIPAGQTSMRLVLTHTPVMVLWGAIITLLVVLALLPGFAGLLVVGPVIGHASWHAYRASVVYQHTPPETPMPPAHRLTLQTLLFQSSLRNTYGG